MMALTGRVVGNDRHCSALDHELTQAIGIICRIGGSDLWWRQRAGQGGGHADIAALAGRHFERDGPAGAVTDRMDLGRSATARAADRLRIRPPFPPAAERCALAVVEAMA